MNALTTHATCFSVLETDSRIRLDNRPLQQRELGHTGIVTSPLALGCAKLGSVLTPLDRRQSISLLHEAFELGVRHFDTASIYGQGDSERYIGAAFKSRRSEVCISTKAGQRLSPTQALMAKFKGPIRWLAQQRSGARTAVARQRAGGVDYCFDPSYIRRSVEDSLRRLQTDFIDIFYLHSPGTAVLKGDELIWLAKQLRREGKIGCLGISCDELAVALAAARMPEVRAIQCELDDSLTSAAILANAERYGKTIIARGVARQVTAEGGSEQALGWAMRNALSRQAVGGLIVGTTSSKHLRANVRAFKRAEAVAGKLATAL